MVHCAFCNSLILLKGKRSGSLIFCNDSCLANGKILLEGQNIPDYVVERTAREIHNGLCPRCGGQGPIDVIKAYHVWTFHFHSSGKVFLQLSCHRCGIKKQIKTSLLCILTGLWGIGIFIVPIQIIRNIAAMAKAPDMLNPSMDLLKTARLMHVFQTSMKVNLAPQDCEEAQDTLGFAHSSNAYIATAINALLEYHSRNAMPLDLRYINTP